MSHDEMSEKLYRYLTEPIPAWTLEASGLAKAAEDKTPLHLAEELSHVAVAKYIIKEANKMKDRTGRSKDEKKKQDSQRGKSTNKRADLARQRLREIQRKAEEDNPENKRRALDAALGAEEAEEVEEEERRTSSMGRVMSGRYS